MATSRTSSSGTLCIFLDEVVEAAAVGEFHDEVALVFPFIEGVDVDDVGVVEAGAGAGFAVEAFEGLGVLEELLFHEFDGDLAFEGGVPGAVDDAHAAGGDFAAEIELAELHGHHDLMPAVFAGFGGEGGQVARDEGLFVAPAATDHF